MTPAETNKLRIGVSITTLCIATEQKAIAVLNDNCLIHIRHNNFEKEIQYS